MLDNTIITKFELSEREKMLKRQFFKREEEPGKKYLFSRPPEKDNESVNNKSNYSNNSQSLVLDQNQNSKISNQLNQLNFNANINDNLISNNTFKSVKQNSQVKNQNLSNTIPDIKNITQEDMNKFYEEAANYLPKSNGGMSPEQVNLLMHQNKIMQRNVDALQETNRSLQDFIIYTMKKDNMRNGLPNDVNGQEINKMEYDKLNKILAPLYNHIENLQSQVKELNQKKREDEINVELDDLIIKNQNNKKNYIPKIQNKKPLTQNEKNNKMMMKTLTTLKGTMTNMTEEMKKIGSQFNEKMQKVLEDTEKNKLKAIAGEKPSSKSKNKKFGLKGKSPVKEKANNISVFKENGGNQNEPESILKNKLDTIDYEGFKSDLIDIGQIKDGIWEEYKSGAPEFPKLTKPKSKIKFSYNLDKELNNIMDKVNNRTKTKPKFSSNLYSNQKNKNPSMKEKVSNAINKEKRPKSSKNIPSKNKNYEIKNNYNMNEINNINNEKDNNDYENKMKELNEMSVVDKMNLYKDRMAKLSGNYEVKESGQKEPNENENKNINPYEQNNINDLGSNHSGVTFQQFNRPSSSPNKNRNKYQPPKVKYGVFHGQKGIPNYNPNFEEEPNNIINPKIVLPDPNQLNNVIKNTIDNYLAAAFSNLKPSEAPKINLDNDNNKKPPQQNAVQRVIEKEYITHNIKEVNNVPQPVVINQPQQQNLEQNNEILEKFVNLAERFTDLEEKISKQMIEQKNVTEKKIEIIKKEKPQPQQPEKKVILPNTDLISKLVIDKIKKQMNIDINLGRQQNQQVQPPQKVEIPPEEDKKEEKIDMFDVNQNIKMEELDEIIRMPHKINLDEYEVSQTSSYLSESIQRNNLNMNNNNQINIKRINKNIDENYNNEINYNKNDKNDNSISKGEIVSNNGNSSQNDDYNDNENYNNNLNQINNINNINDKGNKTGLDLLNLKNLNEQIQDQLNYLHNYNPDPSDNNVVNIPQIDQNNNYRSYLDFLNKNNNNINGPAINLNPFNNVNMDGNSKDNFFNDSGENN